MKKILLLSLFSFLFLSVNAQERPPEDKALESGLVFN